MIITTNRLLIREFTESDWTRVLAYQSNPLYLRYYHWTQRTAEDVRLFIRDFINQQNEEPRTKFQLAVILRSEEKLIGNCGIRKKSHDSREAEIGYELDPDYWGRGYATEAITSLVHFGFSKLMLHRVASHCIAENQASARVLEKLGMCCEGKLRENQWIKGRWWDTLLYSILENEWSKAL